MKTVQSIERALDVLLVFTHQEPELGIVEICRRLGLSKGTGHRLVYTLMSRGFLSQNKQNGKYTLGPKAFELGSLAMSQMEIRKVAHPFLEDLTRLTGETTHLVIQESMEVLYLDKVDSPRAIRMSSFIGQRMPLHCTAVGKVLLSELPEEEVRSICRIKGMKQATARTITSVEQLLVELQKVAEQGYALDDEENEVGLRCIAAPVRDYSQKIIAAISVSAPVMRMNGEMVPKVAEMVKETANKISYQMGFRRT